jgi:hypothetical protein
MKRYPAVWQAEIDAGTDFGRKAAAVIDRLPEFDSAAAKKTADVCDIGTKILVIVQQQIGKAVTCGTCRGFILGLNRTLEHDHNAIARKIAADVEWPDRVPYLDRVPMVSDLIRDIIPKPKD